MSEARLGPFEISRGAQADAYAIEGPTRTVAHIKCIPGALEIAHLFRAAPALLAACKEARCELAYLREQVSARPNGSVDRAYKQCDAAISLATAERGGQG